VDRTGSARSAHSVVQLFVWLPDDLAGRAYDLAGKSSST
jgi:hypothetical protein